MWVCHVYQQLISVQSFNFTISQVYYMTYDLQREYDTINPQTYSDVMVLSGKTRP
ncbi:uncharacterized protein BJ212DRAFT_1278082 [Suillus subaureus]|uniref:Uncharacterized protein n=1 Tax=Suillus subaureus TaxID=48587 RepID=A0A9P7JAI8_9AGAM|nr:uncharacterized protein BJ212DRAFT_1278082 [Suillus subaureus]KAG1811115.1 hypothetical protein BJ212DRAFT_1278082 [Suillus subaureus]